MATAGGTATPVAVKRQPAGKGKAVQKAQTPKRRKLAGLDEPGVPRLLLSVEEAAFALGIRKRKMEELIARGPEHGGVFSKKIGGRRLVPVWTLEEYTRPPVGAI